MSDLLPCPFCGGEARIVEGEESAYVQCLKVKMHRAMFFNGDNDAANVVAEEWNRRAIPAAPVRVKPLVWAKSKTTNWNDDWHTVPTGYTVRCADENGWKWATPLGSFGYASSPNGAKQAAQLDHEVRTRWALEPAPDLAELVDALETARDYVHDASRGALRYRSKADISNMAGEDLVMIDAALAKIKEPQT